VSQVTIDFSLGKAMSLEIKIIFSRLVKFPVVFLQFTVKFRFYARKKLNS